MKYALTAIAAVTNMRQSVYGDQKEENQVGTGLIQNVTMMMINAE